MSMVVQLFFLLMILFAVGLIVLTRNIVHATYALAMALIGIAGVYVLIGAELLAVVQILLYAGGVVILLIFGVMMTNRLRGESVLSGSGNRWIAGVISVALFARFSYLIHSHDFEFNPIAKQENEIQQIGISFLTDHLVAFELVAFILLVVLVGAAYLAKMSSNE